MDVIERPTLLVIDDEPSWRTLYRLEFEERFNVVEATDGRDGLEKLQRVGADLVIVDLSMPRMDGLTFIGCLKDRGLQTPVIVCTGWGPETQTLARTGVWVVAKSPDLSELWRAVTALAPSTFSEGSSVTAPSLPPGEGWRGQGLRSNLG